MKPVELPPVEVPQPETGNLEPLLHEIRHALRRLVESGDETILDLRALPLAPGEEKRLEEALGVGEVEISIQALGTTRVIETRYSGVWLVTHQDEGGEVLGRTIEVTRIPALVPSQPEEMDHSLLELEARLHTATPGGSAP